jgi:hypothetical protein
MNAVRKSKTALMDLLAVQGRAVPCMAPAICPVHATRQPPICRHPPRTHQRPGDAHAIDGGGRTPQLVHQHQAGGGGVVQDVGHLLRTR